MRESDYQLATAMASLRMACAALSQVDLPIGWEEHDLAVAEAWRAVSHVEQLAHTALEKRADDTEH